MERAENPYKSIEREGKIFKIYYSDLKFLFIYLFIFIIIPLVSNTIPYIIVGFSFLIFIGLFFLFRYYSTSKYYKYIASLISFNFFQPKQIYARRKQNYSMLKLYKKVKDNKTLLK